MGNEWPQEVQTNCPAATVPLFWKEGDTSNRNADPHFVHANHSANLASISLRLLPAFTSRVYLICAITSCLEAVPLAGSPGVFPKVSA